jgi:hypothetical protein
MAWPKPLVLACSLIGALLAPATIAAEPTFESNRCPFESPAKLTVSCGTLRVPALRTGEAGGEVRLAVARIAARHPGAGEPVVYLAGPRSTRAAARAFTHAFFGGRLPAGTELLPPRDSKNSRQD